MPVVVPKRVHIKLKGSEVILTGRVNFTLYAIPQTTLFSVSLPPDSDVSLEAQHVRACTHSLFLYVRELL